MSSHTLNTHKQNAHTLSAHKQNTHGYNSIELQNTSLITNYQEHQLPDLDLESRSINIQFQNLKQSTPKIHREFCPAS